MPRKAPVEPPPPAPEISAPEQQRQLLIENWSIHRVPDLEPERAVVHRIARDAAPEGTKLTRDAVTAITKGASVFMPYIYFMAEDTALEKQRKSIQPSDIYKALEKIGLGDIVPGIQTELKTYEELQRKATKAKPKSGKGSGSAAASGSKAKAKKGAEAEEGMSVDE
ncbi:hypothetical protein PENSPDRAFT_693127 [Peniophora sp. CONT]|nr:hypothetical protein PENSPDRAFT_693127 [Peniophora sp. CONT]